MVIANRIALRVLPVLAELFGGQRGENTNSGVILLPTYRVIFLSMLAVRYSVGEIELIAARTAAFAAYAALEVGHTAEISYAAEVAYVVCSTDAADVAHAAGAAFAKFSSDAAYGIDVARADRAAFATNAARVAYAADAAILEQGMGTVELARHPLWEGGMPQEVGFYWQSLKKNYLSQNENWQVWTGWYENILAGRNWAGLPADLLEQLDLKIGLQENDWWERCPAAMNEDIKAWTEAALKDAKGAKHI